jgi:hypothetical protein
MQFLPCLLIKVRYQSELVEPDSTGSNYPLLCARRIELSGYGLGQRSLSAPWHPDRALLLYQYCGVRYAHQRYSKRCALCRLLLGSHGVVRCSWHTSCVAPKQQPKIW